MSSLTLTPPPDPPITPACWFFLSPFNCILVPPVTFHPDCFHSLLPRWSPLSHHPPFSRHGSDRATSPLGCPRGLPLCPGWRSNPSPRPARPAPAQAPSPASLSWHPTLPLPRRATLPTPTSESEPMQLPSQGALRQPHERVLDLSTLHILPPAPSGRPSKPGQGPPTPCSPGSHGFQPKRNPRRAGPLFLFAQQTLATQMGK